jgi:hypothetical protein
MPSVKNMVEPTTEICEKCGSHGDPARSYGVLACSGFECKDTTSNLRTRWRIQGLTSEVCEQCGHPWWSAGRWRVPGLLGLSPQGGQADGLGVACPTEGLANWCSDVRNGAHILRLQSVPGLSLRSGRNRADAMSRMSGLPVEQGAQCGGSLRSGNVDTKRQWSQNSAEC